MKFESKLSVQEFMEIEEERNLEITKSGYYFHRSDYNEYITEDNRNGQQMKCIEKGQVSLMCSNCYNLYTAVIKNRIQTSITSEDDICGYIDTPEYRINRCKYCGKRYPKLHLIDYNISEIISELNKKGYETDFCCESHNDGSMGYISFQKDKLLKYKDFLPISIWLDQNDIRDKRVIMPYNENNHRICIRWENHDKSEVIKELLEFVKQLPNIKQYGSNIQTIIIDENL